jgi:hypothetical protein
MPVLAPGRFSITTPWPHSSESFCPRMRMLMSVGPPAGKGTTILTGRLGKPSADWADAGHVPPNSAPPNSREAAITTAVIPAEREAREPESIRPVVVMVSGFARHGARVSALMARTPE